MLDKRISLVLLSIAAIAVCGWTLKSSVASSQGEVAAKGGPPSGGCCDPDSEPGVGGNPLCFEGHSCCANGNWQCNNPDGSPSCSAGEVCEDCGGSGDSCSSNDDCCSGKCKGNGTCK
jgi:hypothetical protein